MPFPKIYSPNPFTKVAATAKEKEAANIKPIADIFFMYLNNSSILDVGCGLGGPARMIADEKGCTVTGLDLSQEFINTAKALSKLVNLDSKTTFLKADALDLPFERNSFDIVWTQHVQMNIYIIKGMNIIVNLNGLVMAIVMR